MIKVFIAVCFSIILVVAAYASTSVVIDAVAPGIVVQGTSQGVDAGSGNILSVQGLTGNAVSGTAGTTATTTTSLVPLVASKRLYITSFSCANTGSSASLISFQDGSGGTTLWTTIVAAGGGSNLGTGMLPMFKTTAGNALFFAAATASTTIYCSASGFSGS